VGKQSKNMDFKENPSKIARNSESMKNQKFNGLSYHEKELIPS